MSENRWDAEGYAKNARFVSDLGMPVVELLAPVQGESVLDIGCGDGALTAKMAAMGVDVVGVDQSASMVAAAQALGLRAIQADMHGFELHRQFDAVFSNAVMHWTRDIYAVVAAVKKHLRSGGRFVGEFGGFGNVAAIVVAMKAAIEYEDVTDCDFGWYFPTAEEFRSVLEQNGFVVTSSELIPRPTPLPTGMSGWLETFGKPFVGGLEGSKQAAVIERAVKLLGNALRDRAGNWTADYVRLRFHAVLADGAQR